MGLDETPDSGLAVRVLQAYRRECDIKEDVPPVSCTGARRVTIASNEYQDQRAALIDDAIATLEAVG